MRVDDVGVGATRGGIGLASGAGVAGTTALGGGALDGGNALRVLGRREENEVALRTHELERVVRRADADREERQLAVANVGVTGLPRDPVLELGGLVAVAREELLVARLRGDVVEEEGQPVRRESDRLLCLAVCADQRLLALGLAFALIRAWATRICAMSSAKPLSEKSNTSSYGLRR